MHVNNEFKRARGEICVAFLNTVPALSKSGAKFGSAFGPVVFTPEIARARPGPRLPPEVGQIWPGIWLRIWPQCVYTKI